MGLRDLPSLDGRRFAGEDVADGEVSAETVFEYHEQDGRVWARYSGGHIELGFLVGLRSGDQLDFRYVQVNDEGRSSSGHCSTQIEQLDDGRLQLMELWQWESRLGSGSSTVTEMQI